MKKIIVILSMMLISTMLLTGCMGLAAVKQTGGDAGQPGDVTDSFSGDNPEDGDEEQQSNQEEPANESDENSGDQEEPVNESDGDSDDQEDALNDNAAEEAHDLKTDSGRYQGQADSNFIEIKISGVPDEISAKVFMLSDETKEKFDQIGLEKDDNIKFEFYENENGQLVIVSITKI